MSYYEEFYHANHLMFNPDDLYCNYSLPIYPSPMGGVSVLHTLFIASLSKKEFYMLRDCYLLKGIIIHFLSRLIVATFKKVYS